MIGMAMALEANRIGQRGLILTCLVWTVVIIIGVALMFDYETTQGAIGQPPPHWPADSQLFFEQGVAHIVMFAHPRCPCTRASIEALGRIMARTQNRTMARVVFLKPVNVSSGWERSDLWDSAAAIPGVKLTRDVGGAEAAVFGAETSGHVLVFDRSGQRIFSGGITAGRGHYGDNSRLDTCVALINHTKSSHASVPVFGCQLKDCPLGKDEGSDLCPQSN